MANSVKFTDLNWRALASDHLTMPNLLKGLAISLAFHFTTIGSYYAIQEILKSDGAATVRYLDINELTFAPPLDQSAPPPKSVKVEEVDIAKPSASIPIIVPDAEADIEKKLQSQQEMKEAIRVPVSHVNFGEGEVSVQITGGFDTYGTSNNNEPDIDAFVAVEQFPVLIGKAIPAYPEIAKQANLEGKVIAKALINENGDVVKVVIIDGEEIFREVSTQALYKMKFKPAINGNRPVKVWITYPFVFRLK